MKGENKKLYKMPKRDYEFAKLARNEGRLRKISKIGMLASIECSPENRLKCSGMCCNLTNSCRPTFHEEEIRKLPKHLRKFLEKDGSMKVINHPCPIREECLKNPNIKSTDCALAPLGFNKQGTLIIKRWVWLKPCPFYNNKKTRKAIYIAMKDCLIQVFGEKIYQQIVKEVESDTK